MTYRFHLHYGPASPGLLDAYSKALTEPLLREIILSAPMDAPQAAWERVRNNLSEYLSRFESRRPIRIPTARLLSRVPPEYETWLEQHEHGGRNEYEPLRGQEVKELRRKLDQRIVHIGEVPNWLADPVAVATEEMRLAKNEVFNFVMTSTFRIVISRLIGDETGKLWMVLTARDTDRQYSERLDITVCRATNMDYGFEYYGPSGSLPSSSLESFWHCHRRLIELLPSKSVSLLHCHALRVLGVDARAQSEGQRVDDRCPGIVTVTGISREPQFGIRVAEALGNGARIAFRPGEGIWISGSTAGECSKRLIDVLDEVSGAVEEDFWQY